MWTKANVLSLVVGLAVLVQGDDLAFSVGFSDDMVLQQAPAKAAVYGVGGSKGVKVTVQRGNDVVYTTEATVFEDGSWKAYLQPTPGGEEQYTVKAASQGATVMLDRVVFGEVFYCSGQSNMALSLHYTFSAKNVTEAVLRGAYRNIRFNMYGSMSGKHEATSPVWATTDGYEPWYNATYAAGLAEPDDHHLNPFHVFSATCMYFAIELTDQLNGLGKVPPPIGLVQSAVGGTKIEAWMDNTTLTHCRNESLTPGVAPAAQLYYGMVAPFVNMTLGGWVWYQGENNVFGVMGNSAEGTGYGCEMEQLVALWRRVWSAEPGTTAGDAPFGVVSLAAGGSEGHGQHMAHMRWSQTANYGVLPNKAMPRTFMAHAYDLGDPWDNRAAGEKNCSHPDPATGKFGPDCKEMTGANWDPAVQPLAPLMRNGSATPFFMGGIHPRIKRPVGRRLATAYINQFLGGKGSISGPKVSGCRVSSKSIEVMFDAGLLGEDTIAVQEFNYTGWTDSSSMVVCTGAHPLANETTCACSGWDYLRCNTSSTWPCTGHGDTFWFCSDGPGWKPPTEVRAMVRSAPSLGWRPSGNPYAAIWQPAPVLTHPSSPTSVMVDLSSVNVTNGVHAIRYGWPFEADHCCTSTEYQQGYAPCQPAACPVMSQGSWLPANPFFATVLQGKCRCLPPQTCDA